MIYRRRIGLTLCLLLLPGTQSAAASEPWRPELPQLDEHEPPSDPCRVARQNLRGSDVIDYAYGAGGHLTRAVHHWTRYGEESDRISTYEWSEAERTMTRRRVEIENAYWVTVYDEAGRAVDEREYRDERLDQHSAWTYDEAGRLLVEEADDNGDGQWNRRYEYEYDAQGRPLLVRFGLDGVWPQREWRLTYAEDGRSAEVARRDVADGRLHSRHQLTFDEHGRLIEEAYQPQEGTPWTWTWTYDEAGRVARHEMGSRVMSFEYDSAGRLARAQDDTNGDGVVEYADVYEYACQ